MLKVLEDNFDKIKKNFLDENKNYKVKKFRFIKDFSGTFQHTHVVWSEFGVPVMKYFDEDTEKKFYKGTDGIIVIKENNMTTGYYICIYPDEWFYTRDYEGEIPYSEEDDNLSDEEFEKKYEELRFDSHIEIKETNQSDANEMDIIFQYVNQFLLSLCGKVKSKEFIDEFNKFEETIYKKINV